MVFRRRISRLGTIVNSVKHIVDAQGGIVADTKTNVDLVQGVDSATTVGTANVQIGSKVFGIFLNVQVIGTGVGGVLNQLYLIIYKNPGNNVSAADIPKGNVTGASDFKRQIFHTEMIMLSSSSDDIPQTLFKGVIKIPRTFQNMRINDKISLQLFGPGGTSNFCVQAIYKSFL